MAASQIEVRLDVLTAEKAVVATLTFINTSTTDAYVDKIKGCLDGTMKNDVFRITTGGQEVDYTGILAKREPPGPDDFIKLAPREKVSTRVRLDEFYDFLPGAHTYQAFYTALHTYPDRDGFFELKSNEVTFSFTR